MKGSCGKVSRWVLDNLLLILTFSGVVTGIHLLSYSTNHIQIFLCVYLPSYIMKTPTLFVLYFSRICGVFKYLISPFSSMLLQRYVTCNVILQIIKPSGRNVQKSGLRIGCFKSFDAGVV